MTGIYKIQSIINPDKVYIGSAINIKRRQNEHLCKLRKGKHNPKLQNHYNKYGEGDLVFSIVVLCNKIDLTPEKNIIWIEELLKDAYSAWFNATPHAGSSMGRRHTDEAKRKIGESSRIRNIGKKHTEETKRKISEGQKGKKISSDTLQKLQRTYFLQGHQPWNTGKKGTYKMPNISKSKKGKKLTPEHIMALSMAHLGKKRGAYKRRENINEPKIEKS